MICIMNNIFLLRMKKGNVDRRIFVSNLPYEVTWQMIKDLFRKEVGEVNFVELFNVSFYC